MTNKEKIIKFESEIDLKLLIKTTKNYNNVKCYLNKDLNNPKITYGIIQMNEDDKIIKYIKETGMVQKEFQKFVLKKFDEISDKFDGITEKFDKVSEFIDEQSKFNQTQLKFNEYVVKKFDKVSEFIDEQSKFNKLIINRLEKFENYVHHEFKDIKYRLTRLESFHENDIKKYETDK